MNEATTSPGVRFPPPILFAPGIGAGWALGRYWPVRPSVALPAPLQTALSLALLVAGIGLLAWAMATFALARTAIFPSRPARTIVEKGPFRYSRNPMYIALSLMTAGLGLSMDNGWVVLFVPATLIALTFLVIRREEQYLAEAFGESYETYRSRVRRWI